MANPITEFKAVKNNASSSLASAITDADVTLDVDAGDGANFPATADGDFYISIDAEILLCTSRAGDTLTVTRGAQGTTPAAHDEGAAVELRITADAVEELQSAITTGVIEGWAAGDNQNPTIGVLPANAFVFAVDIWVEELFDSDAADEITVGYDGVVNAYVTTYDVSSVAREHIDEAHANAGATLGTVDDTSRSVEVYYVNAGSEPTQGKVYVVLHYIVATAEPA